LTAERLISVRSQIRVAVTTAHGERLAAQIVELTMLLRYFGVPDGVIHID